MRRSNIRGKERKSIQDRGNGVKKEDDEWKEKRQLRQRFSRNKETDLRDDMQCEHLKQDLCILTPLNSTFSRAYSVLSQMEHLSF